MAEMGSQGGGIVGERLERGSGGLGGMLWGRPGRHPQLRLQGVFLAAATLIGVPCHAGEGSHAGAPFVRSLC